MRKKGARLGTAKRKTKSTLKKAITEFSDRRRLSERRSRWGADVELDHLGSLL
jgi:hypothetical protein